MYFFKIRRIRFRRIGTEPYSLQQRRLRSDLIETFKILTGKERVNRQCLPDSPKPVSPKPDSPKLGLGVGVFLFTETRFAEIRV